ncbi:MAG: trypsin-like peptidase domain-containing protein, partial [Planctomycetes bacterium]|nr:trypsin-like peptidase domain-containing protein [Planctomycetota bacterium]
MDRVSKTFVRVTATALIGGSLVGLGSMVWVLRQELLRTSDHVAALAAENAAREARVQAELELAERRDAEQAESLRELTSRAAALEVQVDPEGEHAFKDELSALEERVRALRSAAEEHSRLLNAARTNADVESRYRQLMGPTVRVNALEEVGSGTVLWTGEREGEPCSYVLTAWHVVSDNVGEDGEDQAPLEVDFYREGELYQTEHGYVVAQQQELDLALLEVRGVKHPYLARLATPEQLTALRIFASVYAIGCPLGYPPLPTKGELTSLSKEMEGVDYMMINAPTIFGNSGGGIYRDDGHLLIGVLARISAYKNMIDVAVPHMGLVLPLAKVYTWLDGTDYAFVYRERLEEGKREALSLPASSPTPGER